MCWGLRAWERSNWLIEGLFQPRIPLKGQKKKASVIGRSEPTAEGWALQRGRPRGAAQRARHQLCRTLGCWQACDSFQPPGLLDPLQGSRHNRVGPATLLAPPSLPRKGVWLELRENTFRNVQPLMTAAHPEWQAGATLGLALNQGQLGPLCVNCCLPAHGPWPPRYPPTTHTHTHTHAHKTIPLPAHHTHMYTDTHTQGHPTTCPPYTRLHTQTHTHTLPPNTHCYTHTHTSPRFFPCPKSGASTFPLLNYL